MTDQERPGPDPEPEPAAHVRPRRRELAAAKATVAEIREVNSRANAPRRGRWRRRRG